MSGGVANLAGRLKGTIFTFGSNDADTKPSTAAMVGTCILTSLSEIASVCSTVAHSYVILLCGCPPQTTHILVVAFYVGTLWWSCSGLSHVLHQPPGDHDGNYSCLILALVKTFSDATRIGS
ncbi:hypothetical protein LSAT2_031761 [Lamellibrachia satsuma]|nr:hypothetical protein LSAT2_031761 [Lamellibrachia satsuma]